MTTAPDNTTTTEEIRDNRMDDCPVRPLGHRHGVYFFLSQVGEKREMKPSDFTLNGMASLFEGDVRWLEKHFGRTDRKGNAIDGYVLTDAVCCLMQACKHEGLFDSSMPVRDVGVWRGNGNDEARAQIIVHCGDVLFVGGEWRRAGVKIGHALYPSSQRIARIADNGSTPEDGEFLLETVKKWNFKRDIDPRMIVGFIAQAALGGAARWRAHMIVTGEKGCGKSYLADLVQSALGGAAHDIKNNFTEANLRQEFTGKARCIVLDESEHEENAGRVQAVIELLRHMSGQDGAKIGRGSSGGQAQSYTITGCAYLSSILHVPLKPQDKSRITCIKMVPLKSTDPEDFTRLEVRMKRIKALSPAFRRRMIDRWPQFCALFERYRAAFMGKGLTSRAADQLGTLYAGADTLMHDDMPDSDSIEVMIEAAEPLMNESRDQEEDGEGHQCLNHLYSSITDNIKNGHKQTVGQLLMDALDITDNKVIGPYGLRIEVSGGVKELIVANRSVGLNKLFHGTRWRDGAWVQAMEYLKAVPTGKAFRFGGAVSKGYVLPESFWPRDREEAV